MRLNEKNELAFLSCAAVALLVGCSGSQPPIGAPATLPQAPAITLGANPTRFAGASKLEQSLLYISVASSDTGPDGEVQVYTYPEGKYVQTLRGLGFPFGECVDASGDVFIASTGLSGSAPSKVFEFAHGGSMPIAELDVSGFSSQGCAVDPVTGNLAVTILNNSQSGVAVFKHATGTPTLYLTTFFTRFCTYDEHGNLFVDGILNDAQVATIAELPFGKSTFSSISLNEELARPGSIQWDGKRLAMIVAPASSHGAELAYRIETKGSTGTITDVLRLSSGKNDKNSGTVQFWIQGDRIVGPMQPHRTIGFWRYPKGGKYLGKISSLLTAMGAVVSSAPR